LKYEVFEEGEGPKPKPTDVAVFHYVGRLAKDGKVFDSSVERGQPLAYPVNKLIPGWIEGLPLMSVGSKYRFHIPAALAYGEEGFPPRIGPNEDLVFDVHLLQAAPPEQAVPGDAPSAPEGDTPEKTLAPPKE
jgi:FKBP-type peptidyl-prolyl cis-trans isomerase